MQHALIRSALTEEADGYLIRRKAIDYNVPLITNVQVAEVIVEALRRSSQDNLEIKEWAEYGKY